MLAMFLLKLSYTSGISATTVLTTIGTTHLRTNGNTVYCSSGLVGSTRGRDSRRTRVGRVARGNPRPLKDQFAGRKFGCLKITRGITTLNGGDMSSIVGG